MTRSTPETPGLSKHNPIARPTARIVLLDEHHAVLMFWAVLQRPHHTDRFWLFPGGALEPGETLEHACQRELHEETGLAVHRWGPAVWLRDYVWKSSAGLWYRSEETHVVAYVHGVAPPIDLARLRPEERSYLVTYRWWSLDALEQHPTSQKLAELIRPLQSRTYPKPPIVIEGAIEPPPLEAEPGRAC